MTLSKLSALGTLLLPLLLLSPVHADPTWPPQSFTCYYGKIESETPQQLSNFDLLIVHPGDDGTNLDKDKVAKLRATGKEKTLVGYISIGEDSASPGGPPQQGQDSSGPTFVGKDLKSDKANADYPAYFMDQRAFQFDANGFPKVGPNGKRLEKHGQDGHPDENGVWGSYYAKADDPVWQAKLFERLDHLDKLGLDGFFLDTVDTASPWGDFGWTSSGMLSLVEKIRARYPDKKIVANRGLFYLGQSDRYAKAIDAVLFESMLTLYREETRSASVSPWARWHVQALEDDVIPSQKRNGLALLVLDYLEPDHPDTPVLVQSARTLLQNAPQYCLTFSHPQLRIPGWTDKELLQQVHPSSWPTLKNIELQDEQKGQFTLKVSFDGPIPEGAKPDLRVTERTDIDPKRAAELPLTWIMKYETKGNTALVTADGLDKASTYRAFFRLVSGSTAPQSPFAWSNITTAASDLPGQVTDLSSESTAQGLTLNFTAKAPAQSYRIYQLDDKGGKKLLQETASSTVTLTQPAVDSATELCVVPIDSRGHEGYPSHPHIAVRRNVSPPPSPSAVSIQGNGDRAAFRWSEVPNVRSYRLYVVPQGQTYRVPLVSKTPDLELDGTRPGTYTVFVTAVDKDGNQSAPGPSILWTAK